ncbi:MAG: bifunctional methylenetetrahydrofolate dehydrogenase/methenyltetrahydrofolate cyclohydrolase FolD [Candidatus Altiarchaeales archaeon]|nr:bifunctional methylenetetrahydrofolate dehydrogenase/methenyltetrahydrofolate cyclohydrolase FolD [Candidatus Altiarchaeota archaeon]MBU4342359.1 bifunctional methylenetetrahydrofolate dehydrogenase/methenyltetrahydrofolate cyclohydrolase FolD [Candidatus Altiarchaeota archaeon]MBU4406536.1 bifunctional methylenetetrahydrofolate dehydrogenase/methenyltetrahydrofolate cyclohydrolase FolD [Candidatus Altiarchaeota archaeon]MBU4437223.1 bifunctional methylenetetrahydrofolate dehydrogenase/methen
MAIIDGRKIAAEIKEKVREEVEGMETKPGLATVLVGDDPASQLYVKLKGKACEEAGIKSEKYEFPGDAKEEEVIKLIRELNSNSSIHGILVQLPLPKNLNSQKIMAEIAPEKDVDGFNPVNMGRLLIGDERFVPCTPKGVIRMLEHEKVELKGKDCVIVNHSPVVGKPLAMLLLNREATVSVCHVKTKDLGKFTREAEILIVAAGVPGLIKADMVKKGVVVIDVGINKTKDGVVGDVDFEAVKEKASLITPVPGGVGPMTIAMLLENTILAARWQK